MATSRQYLFAWLRDFNRWRRWEGALIVAAMLLYLATNKCLAQTTRETAEDDIFAELHVNASGEQYNASDAEAAAFDQWESLTQDDSNLQWELPPLLAFDWIRHFGFRHSSTHGRNVGRGIPLEGTSWQNRPYHVDWFIGPLLGDQLINNRVNQENVLFGGLRIGWDIDYYWGLEWRFGRADPNAQFATPETMANNVSYFVSDIDLIYYPWGDSKVRPFFLLGIGAAQIDFRDDASINHNATLATLPFGGGVRFYQSPWLLWRLEVIDNFSFGADGLSSMHNVSITAGMEIRLGARPASYWPWRASRKIW